MRASLLRIIFIASLLSPAARAQSVRWEPPGGRLPAGESTSLQLIFDDCEPKGSPAVPKVKGLTIEYSNQDSSMSWINGTFSHSVTYTYAALLARSQRVEIPSFEVETNKGRLRVPAAQFDPAAATLGSTGRSLESAASSSLDAAPASVWAGEIINLDYHIQATRSYSPDFGQGGVTWNPDPLLSEDWSQPTPYEIRTGGEPQSGLAYSTRAIIRRPGSYQLSPISQLVNLSIGVSGFGFFQQRQIQQFSVTSSAPVIEVRPLPPSPADFSGAVGDFKFTSKIVPTSTTVGEPITWTLELSGTGNWPDIQGLPAREASRDFQVVQPKAKRTPFPNRIFDSTLSEDVVLVPTQAGTYAIKPVDFTYFDPHDGEYKTLTAPGATVTVTAPAGSGGQAPESANPQPAQGNFSLPALQAPASPPPPPTGIPRDTLADSGPAPTPLPGETVALLLLTPFALAVLFWLSLALRRAWQTDPRRGRREARARLSATLAKMHKEGISPNLILGWQHDAAILWEIGHAAPSADVFTGQAWAGLWSDSERTLYGPDSALPSDWTSRAEAALASKPAPKFAPLKLFLPRNLLPFLFVVSLLAVIVPGLNADSPPSSNLPPPSSAAAAYRRGDFAAAEKAWRNTLNQEPANWSARHNLSLALAQQNHWDEAAAQSAAAFVQNPGDEAVRWQFALASDKAGFAPTSLAAFLAPGPLQSLGQLASPAAWQWILIAAAWLAAIAIGCLLAFGYRGGGPVRTWKISAALSALGLAVILGIAAWLGWSSYGDAGDARAVIAWQNGTLRSIPTEADATQKTTPLPAGSVALADKSFLGWIRLTFDNGQTGWVRKEDVVGFWKD